MCQADHVKGESNVYSFFVAVEKCVEATVGKPNLSKCRFGAVEQVLAIEKSDGAKHARWLRHRNNVPQKAKPRQRPCGVSDGEKLMPRSCHCCCQPQGN